MGCDITITAERRHGGVWQVVEVPVDMEDRNYGLFGWLADVRNYSAVPVLTCGHEGLPTDATRTSVEGHNRNHSTRWFLVADLLAFDLSQEFEDRRTVVQTGPKSSTGAHTAPAGCGRVTTYAEEFGWFISHVLQLHSVGAERIIISFD